MIERFASSAKETRELGRNLAKALRPGDLVILSGDLGAGKTTLVQGIGEGLDVEGRVTSPTYIVARVHAAAAGPDLVHVDAYRVSDDLDLETIDLDASLDQCVTVVEWGTGKVEDLSDSRLEIHLEITDQGRNISLTAVGEEWQERLGEAI